MKYKRKPIVRDVVDAIRAAPDSYIVQRDDGIDTVPAADFERDYEPVRRERVAKVKRRKARDAGETAT